MRSRKTFSGKLDHLFGDPLARFHGILAPDSGTGRKNFHEGETGAVALQLESFTHGPARFHDVLVVGERNPLDINRSFERRQHLGHVQRKTFVDRAASPRRSCAALADKRGRRHLAAGHAVDGVIDEEYGNLFAAIGGVHDFSGADGSQIAVALVRQHDLVRTGSLQPRGGGRSASVSHLHVAHIEVVISKH